MATIVRLKANQSPPGHADWVLVERDLSGGHANSGSIAHGTQGATFYVPEPASKGDLEATLDRAKLFAEHHRIKTIYVREDVRPHGT